MNTNTMKAFLKMLIELKKVDKLFIVVIVVMKGLDKKNLPHFIVGDSSILMLISGPVALETSHIHTRECNFARLKVSVSY